MRDGMAKHSTDLGFGKTEIFLRMGLDRKFIALRTDLPVGQISRGPASGELKRDDFRLGIS
jgi:hypothetical protein